MKMKIIADGLIDIHHDGQYYISEIQEIIENSKFITNFSSDPNLTVLQFLCNQRNGTKLEYLNGYSHRIANFLGQLLGILIPANCTPLRPEQIPCNVAKVIIKRLINLSVNIGKENLVSLLAAKEIGLADVQKSISKISNKTLTEIYSYIKKLSLEDIKVDFPERLNEIDGVSFYNFVQPITSEREIIYYHPKSEELAVYYETDKKQPVAEILIANLSEYRREGRICLPESMRNYLYSFNFLLKDIADEITWQHGVYSFNKDQLFNPKVGTFIALDSNKFHHFLVYDG